MYTKYNAANVLVKVEKKIEEEKQKLLAEQDKMNNEIKYEKLTYDNLDIATAKVTKEEMEKVLARKINY